jgi:hypothetical protein
MSNGLRRKIGCTSRHSMQSIVGGPSGVEASRLLGASCPTLQPGGPVRSFGIVAVIGAVTALVSSRAPFGGRRPRRCGRREPS